MKERLFGNRAVANTFELQRIAGIPRRQWTEENIQELVKEFTSLLRKPLGSEKLFPIQAQALHDLMEVGGLFGPICVGGGKTLLSMLCAVVLGSRRPVLVTLANLARKTRDEMGKLSKHWRLPHGLRILTYESLGRVSGAKELENWAPDVIIADEAHRLKNKKAAVTRRVVRYMREKPDTKFVALSGTMMSHGIHDFAHLLRWCLKQNSPLPDNEGELTDWSDALDDRVNPFQRVAPGALSAFSSGATDLSSVRKGFRRRLTETRGVVASDNERLGTSLYIRALQYEVAPIVEQHFEKLRTTWMTPDDWPLAEAVDVWRHARELALGFHYVWDPRPPAEWLSARRDWCAFVRETLSRSRHLDSLKQVADACEEGALDRQMFNAWREVEPSYTPATKALWHDTSTLEVCQRWMGEGPGIVWTHHRFFAQELARLTGVPYYGRDGVDANGREIEKADPKHPIIASADSNKTGRNLQGLYARNLITSPVGGATEWEQLIGRTHRTGQRADEVTVDVLLGCHEHFDAWQKALSGAEAASDMLGHTQKLLVASKDFPTESEVRAIGGFRWSKTSVKS